MDRALAEQLMKDFMALSGPLNSATQTTLRLADKQEQKIFRKGIGEIMNIVYVDLMRPIIKEYPDLDPDVWPPQVD